MKKLRDYSVHEVTYKYENKHEYAIHKLNMELNGYTKSKGLPYLKEDPLVVTYIKAVRNDDIMRL